MSVKWTGLANDVFMYLQNDQQKLEFLTTGLFLYYLFNYLIIEIAYNAATKLEFWSNPGNIYFF